MTAGRNNSDSTKKEWCTPIKYVQVITEFFENNIQLDPCSNEYSIVNANTEYRLPDVDGLHASWDYGSIYVNPPYGSDKKRGTTIKDWLHKCSEAHNNYEAEVIALVPVATNTRHWKDYVWNSASAICFLYDTRLRFLINGKDEGKGAPMACAIVYYGLDFLRFKNLFRSFGAVVQLPSDINI